MPLNEYDEMLAEDAAPAPAAPKAQPVAQPQATAAAPAAPAAQASGPNEYVDILAQDRAAQRQAVKGSMFVAADKQPDRQAQVLKLAKETSLPPEIVERNFDTVAKKQQETAVDYDAIIDGSPGLAKWLEDPNNAALAKDDIPNLQNIEETVKDHQRLTGLQADLANGLAQLYSGLARLPGTALEALYYPQNVAAKALNLPGLEAHAPASFINNPVARYYDRASESFHTPELDLSISGELKKGNYSRAGQALAAQFVANAPQQAALIVGGLTGLAMPAALLAGGTTAAQKLGQTLDEGKVDRTSQTADAILQGTIESAFEHIGTLGILHHWEGAIAKQYGKEVSRQVFTDWAKTMLHTVAGEANEEALTSIAQDLSDYVTGVNPDALQGIGQRALDAGLIGGASGGIMSAPSSTLAGLHRGAKARQSTLARDFYTALGKSAEAAKIRERLPEAQRALVETITKGGPVENIFIPLQAAETYFQSKNENPVKAMQDIGALDAYSEAKATGGDIKIPLATWVEKMVGTEHYEGLKDDIKFDPTHLTVNEQKSESQRLTADLERQASQAEKDAAVQGQDVATIQSESIKAKIQAQLEAAGVDSKTAATHAQVYEAAFKSLGERAGISPLDLFSRYGLQIQGEGQPENPQAGMTLGQEMAAMQPVNPDEATRPIETTLSQGKVMKIPLSTGLDAKVIKNPTPKQAESLVKKAQDQGAIRYFGAPDGSLYMWDAHDLTHEEVMSHLGVELTSDNYAGAGMVHGEADARDVAQRFRPGAPASRDRVLFQVPAFHGSPHDFEQFKLNKIGTGEGAQAYGWGLYFAGNREVAEWYKEKLGAGKDAFAALDAEENARLPDWVKKAITERASDPVLQNFAIDGFIEDFRGRIEEAKAEAAKLDQPWLAQERVNNLGMVLSALEKLKASEDRSFKTGGKLYEVELTPNDEDFLEWDKPFSEQSEKVKKALEGDPALMSFLAEERGPGSKNPDLKHFGSSIYGFLAERMSDKRYVVKDPATGQNVPAEIQTPEGAKAEAERKGTTWMTVNNGPSPEAASKYLLSLGIPGLKYLDGNSRNSQSPSQDAENFNYVVFDDSLVQIKNKFNQSGEDGARGRIRFGANRQFNIDLLKNADRSTFLHETGHFYLEVMSDLSKAEGASQQIRDDFETLREWLGAKEGEKFTTDQHEQFARGFEAYLMEGKAPSDKLRQAFARFRTWLVSIYHRLSSLNVELTPEVRQVFDRMLATDQEIKVAQAQLRAEPLFVDPKAMGMSDKQVYRYLEAVHHAEEEAKSELERRVMEPIRRENEAIYREEKARMAEQVEKEISAQPVYHALSKLQEGRASDPSAFKLSRQLLIQDYGKDIVQALPKGITTTLKDAGLHPDMVAEGLGFVNGHDLIDQLARAVPLKEAVKQETERRMTEKHGDLLQSPKLEPEAMAALHNHRRGQLLRMELEILAKNDLPVLKDVMRRVARRVPTEKAVREQAAQIVGKRKTADLNPAIFQRAETRAANEAADLLHKGDINGAFQAKRRELLNHELYRAAVDAQESVDKAVERFKKIAKTDPKASAKTRDADLVNAAKALLAGYGIGQSEKTALEYLEQTKRYDPDMYETVNALIDNATEKSGFAKSYKDLSFDDFVALKDSVDALWDLAKSTRQIEIDGQMMERDQVKAELSAHLASITKEGQKDEYDRKATAWDKTKLGLLGMRASLRRVEHWVSAVDGDQPIGPFRKYLWTPVKESIDEYRAAKKQFIAKYLELVKGIADELKDPKDIVATELRGEDGRVKVFKGKAELLGAMLHAGNESNLAKLLKGYGWGSINEDGTLERSRWDAFTARMQREGVLTKRDYDFLQAIWDLHDELRAPAQKAHKQMYGHYFNEVTATRIQTPFGEYRGGYVPAVADTMRAQDAAIRADKEALEKQGNTFMFPTAGRGFTKSRVENYSAPLVMDLGLVPTHIDKVLRFTYVEPKVKSAGRLIMDRDFRKTLNSFDQAIAGDMLVPWLQRAATQSIETPSQGVAGKAVDRFYKAVRTRSSLQTMTLNVINTMQNVAGFSLAALKVEGKYLRNGMWDYVRAPKKTTDAIAEMSTFMKNAMEESAAELQKTAEDIVTNPGKLDLVRDHAVKVGYFFQKAVQGTIDAVVWKGAYEQAIERGETHDDAVRLADSAVRETQSSFAAEDISRAETGTPFMRLFTMFYSYFNMQANLLGTEFQKVAHGTGLKRGYGRLLYVYTFGMMAPAVISELIARGMSGGMGSDGSDDEDYLTDALEIFFGSQAKTLTAMVPGGKALELTARQAMKAVTGVGGGFGKDDKLSVSPAVNALESALSAPASAYSAIVNDGSKKKAVRDSLTLLGMISGLPLGPLSKPIGYGLDVMEGNTQPTGPIDAVRGLATGKSRKE